MNKTESKPRVSVLIPIYNRVEKLSEAISSILGQTFTDFELIICDDGSQEEVAAVVNTFSDERIRLIRNEVNMGLAYTRNRLISEARGEFCATFDSDDICLPHRLAAQVEYLDTHPECDLCSGAVVYMDNDGNTLKTIDHDTPNSHEELKIRLLFRCP